MGSLSACSGEVDAGSPTRTCANERIESMFRFRRNVTCSRLVTILLLLGSPAFAQSSPTYNLGRTPTAEEIRASDISIGPTGEELPPGRGTAKQGAEVFV